MYYLGVDLGGTKILTALADKEGQVLARSNIPTQAAEGQEVIIGNIKKTIDTVLEESGITKDKIAKIGIGSPGPLNSKEGIIYETANLPWKNVPLVDIMEEQTGRPVSLENDANAAALGEKWFGAGKDVEHMIYVTVSTGIGGGIIIDKRILQGADGAGGEIGHMVIKPEGPVCGCGKRGCLEALASGTAIARIGKESYHEDKSTLIAEMAGDDPEKIDAILVAQAAKKGDPTAQKIYEQAGYYLGMGLANLINIFNTEKIVFGGGVMKDRELLNEPMMDSLQKNTLPTSLDKVELTNSELKSDTGVMGALAVAMEDIL
ncbi:MAG: ROK family protein [bacterium]